MQTELKLLEKTHLLIQWGRKPSLNKEMAEHNTFIVSDHVTVVFFCPCYCVFQRPECWLWFYFYDFSLCGWGRRTRESKAEKNVPQPWRRLGPLYHHHPEGPDEHWDICKARKLLKKNWRMSQGSIRKHNQTLMLLFTPRVLCTMGSCLWAHMKPCHITVGFWILQALIGTQGNEFSSHDLSRICRLGKVTTLLITCYERFYHFVITERLPYNDPISFQIQQSII